MAENETPEAAAPEAPQIKMNILAQYIRDMSFENILAQ
jgi:preprotein translocase subunit SecB